MAEKEIYDYVALATPDSNVTLTVVQQGDVQEIGVRDQLIHVGDDGSEERIELGSGASVFYITVPWQKLSASDAGTILDFWADDTKGAGRAKTFKLAYCDGHTYVVRFDTDMTRVRYPSVRMGAPDVTFKVLGRIADA